MSSNKNTKDKIKTKKNRPDAPIYIPPAVRNAHFMIQKSLEKENENKNKTSAPPKQINKCGSEKPKKNSAKLNLYKAQDLQNLNDNNSLTIDYVSKNISEIMNSEKKLMTDNSFNTKLENKLLKDNISAVENYNVPSEINVKTLDKCQYTNEIFVSKNMIESNNYQNKIYNVNTKCNNFNISDVDKEHTSENEEISSNIPKCFSQKQQPENEKLALNLDSDLSKTNVNLFNKSPSPMKESQCKFESSEKITINCDDMSDVYSNMCNKNNPNKCMMQFKSSNKYVHDIKCLTECSTHNEKLSNTEIECNLNTTKHDSSCGTNVSDKDIYKESNTELKSDETFEKISSISSINVNDTIDTDTDRGLKKVDNWEDLFDENGSLKISLLTDEEDSVRSLNTKIPKSEKNVPVPKIQKANSKSSKERNSGNTMTHVVEIYGFPTEFQTRDLLKIFESYHTGTHHIKWVDDNHALGVFPSEIVAQEVLKIEHPLIKLRSMNEASKQSLLKAKKNPSAMMPMVTRPQTCPHTARRMVSGALGIKLKSSKEDREKEKQILKDAREKKRLLNKQQDDAWEGHISSS